MFTLFIVLRLVEMFVELAAQIFEYGIRIFAHEDLSKKNAEVIAWTSDAFVVENVAIIGVVRRSACVDLLGIFLFRRLSMI